MKNWWLCASAVAVTKSAAWCAPGPPNPVASDYEPLGLLAPFHNATPVNRYRGAAGRPGPD